MYTNSRIQMRFLLQTSHVLYVGIVPVYIYHALRLAQAMQRVATSEIAELVRRALTRHGLANDMAECVAKVVTAAERDECRSHGLFRVPGYCHALATGHVSGSARPELTRQTGAAVVVDGRGCFAPCAWELARAPLVSAAKRNGLAIAVLRRVHHFSALWYEVEEAAEDGLAALACVSTSAFVAHPGSGAAGRVYGTDPIAFAFPARPAPLVWDMATAAMARGEIQLRDRAGEALPAGAGVDEAGIPSTDGAAVLRGAQLPLAGHKGANLALAVELLAGALTGSPFADEARFPAGALPPGGVPTLHGEVTAFNRWNSLHRN